jgi:Tfp pilus assembly protein PilZ
LSKGGCFIQTRRALNPGDEIFLCLWDPSYGGSILRGCVRYQFSVGSQHPPIGIGVEFVGLLGADVRDIEQLLEFYNESPAACS